MSLLCRRRNGRAHAREGERERGELKSERESESSRVRESCLGRELESRAWVRARESEERVRAPRRLPSLAPRLG